jgi:tetratricopeptide (TPR) repeat protein
VYYRDIARDWRKAREICAKSLDRYPNVPAILLACSSVEGDLCKFAKSVELSRRAVALDPLAVRPHSGLMLALYRAGRFDEALSEAEAATRLGPESYMVDRHRALILAAKGDLAGGLKAIDDARARLGGAPDDWMTVRCYILGRMGRHSEAGELLREYARVSGNQQQLGVMYLGLGERNRALECFEKALETEPTSLAHTIPQYYARVLDGDPRFEALRKKLGTVVD